MFDKAATQEQVFDLVAKGVIDKYAVLFNCMTVVPFTASQLFRGL